ncbi:sensor histidine kinase N-terminal domain-containing protein [Curvibacter sp. CHRR-16]|uniref:sensor histidine kinase n=1 Tax=Curvibacter sp. CHRR-16 TaxID=2835872 RepID=UPI001BD9B57B|nr:sensor histidine kinase [Curvibacter sp. CHRR-16]MBT0569249.1 sensor histidine kinase N-terminal domain-containing protein [Curvibacter sp. CHRR-16]
MNTLQRFTSLSLRSRLLLGILLPIVVFVGLDTYFLYSQALAAVNQAYDRTLLASAKAIGERLQIMGHGETMRLKAEVPYAALEAFEADNRTRMVYQITDTQGHWVDGINDLPRWTGKLPNQGPYAALVDFYDDRLRGEDVRVAVLLQPVATGHERTMATVQVAETLQLRRTLARDILLNTLRRQTLLVAVITLVVLIVVQRVTRPIRHLGRHVAQRQPEDLTPLPDTQLPPDLRPLSSATNQVMARLQQLVDNQKRFVRDAAHQLRTPLAVLKIQVQSALRGDVPPQQALLEMQDTVNRATTLANQMLSVAKVEQLRQQQDFAPVAWDEAVREVALDVAPLMADKQLDFELDCVAAPNQPASYHVLAHRWMLQELTRNLLHNAIRHSPVGGRLIVQLAQQAHPHTGELGIALCIADCGSGLSREAQERLFQPFGTSHSAGSGSGLGLTICHNITQALGGHIRLSNRDLGTSDRSDLPAHGVDAVVWLPLSQ